MMSESKVKNIQYSNSFLKSFLYNFTPTKEHYMEMIETRGRKPQIIKIEPGEIKIFKLSQGAAVRYHARKNNWHINTRTKNGKLLVFRES